jgi:hypothetical protein
MESTQMKTKNDTNEQDNDDIISDSSRNNEESFTDSDNEKDDDYSSTEFEPDTDEEYKSEEDNDDEECDENDVPYTQDDIDKHVRKCVTKKQTFKQTPITYWKQSGSSSLQNVTIIREECPVTHEQHWLYYTCGFSDVYDSYTLSESDQGDDIISGKGFELCLRLKRNEVLETCLSGITNVKNENLVAPDWPVQLFRILNRYIENEHTFFDDGDWMPGILAIKYVQPYQQKVKQIIEARMKESDTEAPSLLEALEYCDKPVLLNSYLFRKDPVLDKVFTRSGNVEFIQLIPITDDELNQACSWVTTKLITLMSEKCGLNVRDKSGMNSNPLLVCDIYRGSCLEDESISN